jgi:GGDEF domain-containing protein
MPIPKTEPSEFVSSSGDVFDMIDGTIEEHAEHTETECCLILVDIDGFRGLLEAHGAVSGDQVLFAEPVES